MELHIRCGFLLFKLRAPYIARCIMRRKKEKKYNMNNRWYMGSRSKLWYLKYWNFSGILVVLWQFNYNFLELGQLDAHAAAHSMDRHCLSCSHHKLEIIRTYREMVWPMLNRCWTHNCDILPIGHTTTASDDECTANDCTLLIRLGSACMEYYYYSLYARPANRKERERDSKLISSFTRSLRRIVII